jgi:Cys-tRNA(Pro)/Cys-tRNA(Cys) deacylase
VTKTRAIELLQKRGVDFTVHEYEMGQSEVSYGEAVAAALGVEPERLFKTLVARVDERPVVAIVPVSGKLSLKKLARAVGGKRAVMADAAEAERMTGYVVGGISPFAQRRRLPAFLDHTAANWPTMYVSAGVRGLQIEIDPGDLIEITGARPADLAG